MNLIQKILAFAVENGFKSFSVEGHDTFGYIVTPDDNVISVNKGTWGGATFSFNYIPSKEHGQGCACMDEEIYDIPTIAEIKGLEMAGKNFAKSLRAKFYQNSDQWYKQNYWQQKGLLREVTA